MVRKPFFLILWAILVFLLNFKHLSSLNLYFLLKYAELIVAYGTTVILFKDRKLLYNAAWLFISLCSFEGLLGLLQFFSQKSLGLKWLGESVLNPSMFGVAKIVSGGTHYIRAYGTFPHPNLLAAFLVIGVLLSFYLFSTVKGGYQRILSGAYLCISILGLFVTFSRSGFFAVTVALFLMGAYLIYTKAPGIKLASVLVLASVGAGLVMFFPLLATRATLSDNSSLERIEYSRAGLEMIKDNPIFGVGIGESVLHMEQYMHRALQPWEKQPIHNYFILIAAEFGLPGVLIILWLLWLHLEALLSRLKVQITNFYAALLPVSLIAVLLLMQFDHYFYTLEQTRLLLWIILGVSASLTLHNRDISETPKV
ncbi:MAG: O-antigen ligase family protein [Patescibacteria group bacterium]|nr:O-antigen ligase family protein [Patescibacteria group bacterium]